MTLPAGPKIDCHIHAIDPVRFPYADDTPYRPSGQEIAPAAQLIRVLDVFDVRHALVVATNTGYGSDSRILLDTLRASNGRFKGVAVGEKDVDVGELERLKKAGVVGIAYNAPFHGADYYRDTGALVEKLAELGLFLQIQVENDQLLVLLPLIERTRVRLVFDHCGRPVVADGLTGKASRRCWRSGVSATPI
jgi:predicted TIM-barrel fold metal-dependent hydrolase